MVKDADETFSIVITDVGEMFDLRGQRRMYGVITYVVKGESAKARHLTYEVIHEARRLTYAFKSECGHMCSTSQPSPT